MYLTFKIKYMGGIIWANVDKVLLIKSGFLPNKLNKYSIRKFTVGTASILLGSTLIFGSSSHEAKAAEEKQVDPITQANQNDSSERSLENTNQPTVNNEAPQMSSTLQAEEGSNAEAPQSEPTRQKKEAMQKQLNLSQRRQKRRQCRSTSI